jgi:hypothetical protein
VIRRLALVVACLAPVGCAGPATLALAPSVLPNLGLVAGVSAPLAPSSRYELEARLTEQFLDDKTFADNDFPEAGDWSQLELGLVRLTWSEERAWSTRFGLIAFRARGEPNLVDEAGDYLGAYVGVGRFTRFAPGLAFGPELALIFASGDDPRVLVPQITWGLRWTPGLGRAGFRGRSGVRDP